MKHLARAAITAVAVALTVPIASAQTVIVEDRGPVVFTPEQRTVIYRSIRRAAPRVVVRDLDVRIGVAVPPSVELYSFPEEVYVEVPTLRRYRYLQVGNELVLVDPRTSEIVEIIQE